MKFASLFLTVSLLTVTSAWAAKDVSVTTINGNVVTVSISELEKAYKSYYANPALSGYNARITNYDGSVTVLNPRAQYAGVLYPLSGNYGTAPGLQEHLLGLCKFFDLGVYVTSEHNWTSTRVLSLNQDGSIASLDQYGQLFLQADSVTCKAKK